MKIYAYRVQLLISFNLSMKFPLTSAFYVTHLHVLNSVRRFGFSVPIVR